MDLDMPDSSTAGCNVNSGVIMMIKGGKGEKPKFKILQPDDWDGQLLAEKRYFTVVLNSGEKLEAKFKGISAYCLMIETASGLLLIPKHSVRYYILENFTEDDVE